jgi:hypothetical protein
MAIRPNFDRVDRDGTDLLVVGTSDPVDPGDILGIRVTLAQGGKAEASNLHVTESIGKKDASWTATLPAEGFVAGPAVAFGVEIRHGRATTTTWAQPVEIPKAL